MNTKWEDVAGIPKKDLLRPDEVARYFSLSVRTIYNWIDIGKLPAQRIGPFRTIRVRKEDMEMVIHPLSS